MWSLASTSISNVWSNRNAHKLPVGMYNGTFPMEKSWAVSLKLNIQLKYDQASPLVGTYMKTYVHTKPSTWLFVAALLIMTQNGDKPNDYQ